MKNDVKMSRMVVMNEEYHRFYVIVTKNCYQCYHNCWFYYHYVMHIFFSSFLILTKNSLAV